MRIFATVSLLLLVAAPAGALERYPTANRLGISFGFGFGSISLSSFHQAVDGITAQIRAQGATLDGDPKSGLQINAEIGFRYYFPYYILGQVGYGSVYNWTSNRYTMGPGSGTVESWQLAMEVPLLVGGYYPFLGRLYVFGAIGPSPFFYNRSWWDAEPGGLPDYRVDTGVGFHALAGAEFLVARSFAVGLELRYRYLKGGELRELNSGQFIPGGYTLDFSGISLGLTLRAFAM